MRAALLSFPLLLLGCVDDTPETLTVVVDANRARAQADQAKLAEMQRVVDEARHELLRTREDLTVLREKLVAAGAMSADEARKLEEKERALAAREAKLPAAERPAIVGGAGLTRADVEAMLLAQETRLAALLGSAPSPEGPATPSRAQQGEVEGLLAALADERDARGLHISDLPRGRELLARSEAQLRAGRADAALASAQALGAEAGMTKVDLAFVQRKYARASGLLPALPESAQGKAKALLGEANARVGAGDAVGASRKLTALLLLAE